MIHDLVYLGFGIFALYVVARVRLDRLVRAGAPVDRGVGLALLVAVRAIGVTINGGKRWLNLHVIYLQPSELFKLFTVALRRVARATPSRRTRPLAASWRCGRCPSRFGCALIVIEPDIGTTSVVLAIAFAMLAVAGLSSKMLARIVVLGVAVFGVYMASKPYSARPVLLLPAPQPPTCSAAATSCSRAASAGRRRSRRIGARPQPREVGTPAQSAHRLHLHDHR